MRKALDIKNLDWDKGAGLLPAIVQDETSMRVLMLGFVNKTSLQQTLDTGKMTFYSRSREALWVKGETSGNFLYVSEITMDCDRDTLLVLARPAGPVCHLGTETCFSNSEAPSLTWLTDLEALIYQRKISGDAESYTSKLFKDGVKRIAQKVGEEGVEVALAAAVGDEAETKDEVADLLYHLLVLLAAKDVPLTDVISVLRARHNSGT